MTLMNDIFAKADLAELLRDPRSKIERNWETDGPLLLADELGARVVWTRYEPVVFKLPGGRFTPDFQHVLEDGRLVFVECKGSRRQRGYRDARSKLRAAAALNRWALWFEVRQVGGGGFELERI